MKDKRIIYIAICATVVVLGGALRALFAYNAFYDPEEMFRVRETHADVFSDFITESISERTPFLDGFLFRSLFQLNDSEIFVRLCSASLGVFYVALLCALSSRMLGNRRQGIFVATLAAFSPLFVFYSGIVRYHNFHAIFTLMSVYFFWLIMQGRANYRHAAAYGLTTALAMMSHYYTIYLILSQAVVFLLHKLRDANAWKNIAVAATTFAVSFSPFTRVFLLQIKRADVAALDPSTMIADLFSRKIFDFFDVIFHIMLGEHYLIHSRLPIDRILLFLTFIILLFCLISFVVHTLKSRGTGNAAFPALIFFIAFFLAFATSEATGGMPASAKYLMPFAFLFYMVLAWTWDFNGGGVRVALASSIIAVLALAQINLYLSFTEKPTVKTVADHICDDIAKGGAVLFSAEAIGIPGFGKIDYSHEMALEYFAEYAPCAANVALVDDGRFPGRTRLRPGKLNVVKLISPGDTESIEALLEEHGRLWLFYFNLGREPHEHLKREILPTEAYRTLAKLAPPAESVIFKVSPRRDYFKGGAFLFLK